MFKRGGIHVEVPELNSLEQVNFSVRPAELLFVELFCGSARLSKAVAEADLNVLAIDKVAKARQVSVTCLDLTTTDHQKVLFECLCKANVGSLHIAPPCGTASRAREIPMNDSAAMPRPKPLRSAEDLWGDSLPSSHVDRLRVQAANTLYVVSVVAASIAARRGSLVSVENPSNSHFWALADRIAGELGLDGEWGGLQATKFHSCMWGASRPKLTTFRATPGLADPLAKECDKSHTHEPWSPMLKDGKPHFPTSEEAAYPLELCKAHAFNLWTQLLKKGIKAQALHLHQDALGARDLRQFTAKRVPPLLGEYWFIGDSSLEKFFPDRCKNVQGSFLLGKNGDEVAMPKSDQEAIEMETSRASRPSTVFAMPKDKLQPMVGVYRTPVQAIGAALTLKHPLEFATPLPDLLTRCVVDVLNMGPAALIQLRSRNLAWILERRIALSSKEVQARAEMHPDMARCLEGKQTCLWEELLLHTGFPDDSLVREVRQGIEVVGAADWSPVFKRGYSAPELTEDQWQAQAVWRRKAAIAACKPADDPDLAESLWQQTLDETEAGWIKGPFMSEDEVSAELGVVDWVCTKRFAIRQNDKVRVIDNAKASGINGAFSTYSKLQLMDADTLISLILLIVRCAFGGAKSNVVLSTGEVVTCVPHPSWKNDLHLVGRTLDLAAAYKQMGMNPARPQVRPLVVWSPEHQRPVFFVATALMFGTTSSVYAFNRASLSLWHLALTLGKLWITCYFDDYPGVDPSVTSKSSRAFLEGLLQAVGWRYAAQGKKAQPHAPIFNALGVTLDLTSVHKGVLTVSNKAERTKELMRQIGEVLEKGHITSSEAAALHGRLNFAQGQLFGCMLKPAMAYLGKWADGRRALAEDLAKVMAYLAAAISRSPPRVLRVSDSRPPVVIFTDGAYEPSADPPSWGSGVVLLDPLCRKRVIAEVEVPEELVSFWVTLKDRKQIITHLELWPVLVALERWGTRMRGRRILLFLDNNGVRDAVIKGSSKVADVFAMLAIIARRLDHDRLSMWTTRIPSKSNPADLPSRHEAGLGAKLFSCELEEPWQAASSVVAALLKGSSFLDFMAHTYCEK